MFHMVYEAERENSPGSVSGVALAAEDKYKAWVRLKNAPPHTEEKKALHRAPCKAPTRTASWARNSEETANVIDATNRQLGDITAWGRTGGPSQVCAGEPPKAMVISRSREDPRLLEGKLKFGDDTLVIKDSINILGVEVDSRLRFDCHLETVARRVSLRVTLLRRVRHLLDADSLMRLKKAQVRPVMEYSPLTWMSSAQCHLSLLDKVQRRAEAS
ncbi:hypothetical protein GWK47_053963 [Chionoecetes opilio]|uniref:Uncharacterized protein n=1 Tax=Chionoecetes opilio TaxID=41210 RepID=A0A8J4Y7G3_CHIOP|nr:hypothetical protein GWK47_053963 [Chionoecetes opilio]